MKRYTVTAVIYCYITTDFYYAKRDSRLSAYGGVMLQRVCIEENVNGHFTLNFSKFCNKNNWPQCLVVFSIVILLFSAMQSLLSDLSLFEFPLVRRVKSYLLDSEVTPAQSKKKTLKACQPPEYPPQNPYQLNSKPNSSPQHMLQSSGFLVY